MMTIQDTLHTYLIEDPLPAEAAELFGHEVEDAFRLGSGADEPEPVVIAAADGTRWRAGIYLLIERIGRGPGAEHVASIRQLVVRPASRGRGLAGWLLRRAHAVAVEMGCRRIRSTAGWGCPDHRAMYHRLGYHDAESDQRPYLVEKAL